MFSNVEIICADITTLEVDAIVNAANVLLRQGSGVSKAIFKKAGRRLKRACNKIGFIRPGDAVITPGFKLPSKYVIHTMGPLYRRGIEDNNITLANCYKNSLVIARASNIRTLAFPCISTGAYGFPFKEGAEIALRTLKDEELNMFEKIYLVCYTESDYQRYKTIDEELRYAYGDNESVSLLDPDRSWKKTNTPPSFS